MDLERELKDALERKSPPAGFAEGVMRKIQAEEKSRLTPEAGSRGLNRWRAVAAATLLTAVIGGWASHQAARQREGERAKEEVLLALRITSEKLSDAREQVNEIGSKN